MADAKQQLTQIAETSYVKVAIIGLLLAGVYFLGPYDSGESLTRQLTSVGKELVESERQLAATKKAMEDAEEFGRKVKEMTEQFEHIREFMPERMGRVDLIEIIIKTSMIAGVKLVSSEPKAESTKGPFYEMSRVSFKIEGSFAQVVTFLSELSKVPRLLTFDSSEVETISSVDPEKPMLSFTGVLVGYRYFRPPPAQTDQQANAELAPDENGLPSGGDK